MKNMEYVNWMGNVNVLKDSQVLLAVVILKLIANYHNQQGVWMNVIIEVNVIMKLDYVHVKMDLVVLIVLLSKEQNLDLLLFGIY